MASLKMIAASLLLIIASFGAAMAEDHYVNWYADVDYEAWAVNTTLIQGDKLLFVFDTTDDNVDVVQTTEDAYNTCNPSSDPSVGVLIGDAGASLVKTGMYYFINSYPNKCSQGWKLRVNVLSESEASTSTPPPPMPFFPEVPPSPPVAPGVQLAPPSPDFMPLRPRSGAASSRSGLAIVALPLGFFCFLSLYELGFN